MATRRRAAFGRLPRAYILHQFPLEDRRALDLALRSDLVVVFQPEYVFRWAADRLRPTETLATDAAVWRSERALFLWLHYCRHRLWRVLDSLEGKPLSSTACREILEWARPAYVVRCRLLEANRGLAITAVRRCGGRRSCDSWDDLFQDAAMQLAVAIDQFDAKRGFRFSSYAYRALYRKLIRSRTQEVTYQNRFAREAHELPEPPAPELPLEVLDLRAALADNRAGLDEQEQAILTQRYGLGGIRSVPRREYAKRIGRSPERLRQIEAGILAKLRAVLEGEHVER
jgi:RNA polymerase primary sigma factor